MQDFDDEDSLDDGNSFGDDLFGQNPAMQMSPPTMNAGLFLGSSLHSLGEDEKKKSTESSESSEST